MNPEGSGRNIEAAVPRITERWIVTERLEQWVEKAHTQGTSPKKDTDRPVPRRPKVRRQNWVTNW